MEEGQALGFLYLLALLLFLLPLVLRSARWNRWLSLAAVGLFGAALLLALYRVAAWLIG